MADNIQINPGSTGPEAPDQQMYEGFTADEQEASTQGQDEQAPAQYEVPDKFVMEDGSVDVEALSKSYLELEKARSSIEPQKEEASNEVPEGIQHEALSEISMQNYTAELSAHGNLTEDSYAKLENAGFPRELVSEYVQGQIARSEAMKTQALESVGGSEGYAKLSAWAEQTLSDAEIDAFDSTITAAEQSGNIAQIQMAIEGLKARYDRDGGSPTLLAGDTGSSTASGAFRSWAEVTKAMRNPEYRTDPAYQKDVQNRLAVSNLGQ